MTVVEPLTPEQSKLIFNNSYMFRVLVEIAATGDEGFSQKQIADRMGIGTSIINPIVHRLHDAQFLDFIGQVPGERTKLFKIHENYWWDAARKYVDAEDRGQQTGG